MITHLDHVAIAVESLNEGIQRFVEDFGLKLEGTEDVVSEQTATAFLPLPGTRIELVAPLEGAGPIAQALSKRGPGVHHLCFRTDDIESDMKKLSDKGYRFISEEPRPGAHGTRVAFIHPKSTGGVLIELAEHP
ncbi:MAG: methylmalonyl-CoA epimerase [Myxococcota bacterium]|nr:methylmalonyl-CoA epimerase [Myxococcota bacterium]